MIDVCCVQFVYYIVGQVEVSVIGVVWNEEMVVVCIGCDKVCVKSVIDFV